MNVYAEKQSNFWGAVQCTLEVLRRCLPNTSFPSIPLFIGTSDTSEEVRRYFCEILFFFLFCYFSCGGFHNNLDHHDDICHIDYPITIQVGSLLVEVWCRITHDVINR